MNRLGTADSLLKSSIVLLCALACGSAFAETPTFEITLALSESWTDNPAYVRSSDSDVVNSITLDIPFRRVRPNHTWSFLYRPSYRSHSEFSDLNHLEHLVSTTLEGTPSAKSHYDVNLTYLNSQSQDLSEDFADEAAFLTNRTDRESLTARVSVDREVAPLWRINGNIRARTLAIDRISGFDSGVTEEQLGDQISTWIGAGASYRKSARTSIHFGYLLRGFELDLSSDETVHSVSVGATTTVSARTSVSYGAGVASRTGGGEDEIEIEAHGGVSRKFKRGSVTVDADRSVRNGDAVAGGSTVSSVGVGYGETLGRRTQWKTSARWSLRDALDKTDEDATLLRGSLSVTIRGPRFEQGRLNEGLGLKFKGSIVDQSGAEDDAFNSSYYVVTAALLAFFSN